MEHAQQTIDCEEQQGNGNQCQSEAGNPPLAIQAAKITIAQVLKDESQRDMAAIKDIGTACMDSEDFREGRQAFMEKRKPQLKGK